MSRDDDRTTVVCAETYQMVPDAALGEQKQLQNKESAFYFKFTIAIKIKWCRGNRLVPYNWRRGCR